MAKWYGRAPNHGDKMCSWILNRGDELIVQSSIPSARGDRINTTYVDEIETQQLKGSSKNDPIVRDLNELVYQGGHHQTQDFYPR